jgi:peptide deformylase
VKVGPSEILQLGHPGLRRPSAPVGEGRDAAFGHQARVLAETLEAFRERFGFGRAIAAPQIGVLRRLIAVNLDGDPFLVVDPQITWRSEDTFTMWDDCMSFPGLLVRLRRHRSISLAYVDAEGAPRVWERMDLPTSELFQHEVDHLDGVLGVDRAEDVRDIVSREAFDQLRDEFEERVDHRPAR